MTDAARKGEPISDVDAIPAVVVESVDVKAPPRRRVLQPPSLRLMLRHPAHIIAFGLGSGLAPMAPGTWGTLLAWASFATLAPYLTQNAWLIVIVATLLIGTWAAQYTGKVLGVPDHGAIVIDEIAAFWIVLLFVPATAGAQALAFGLFRLFDIVKPPPIRALDQRLKNGLGVMLDDLLAAFYALLAFAVITRFL